MLHLVDNQEGITMPVSESGTYSFTVKDASKTMTNRFYLKVIPPSNTDSGVNVSVFPNPVVDKLFVKLTGSTMTSELSITDMNGKIWLRKIIDGGYAFEMESLPAGVYVVHIRTSTGVVTRKVIKQGLLIRKSLHFFEKVKSIPIKLTEDITSSPNDTFVNTQFHKSNTHIGNSSISV